jgi:superkiller protein 3
LSEIQQLLQDHNFDAAETQIAVAMKQFPQDAAFYDLSGVLQAGKGNYDSARAAFLKAIELDPLLVGAYLNLGHLYAQAGAVETLPKALQIYTRLLEFDPGNPEANYQSAVLLERQKAFRASLDHLAPFNARPGKGAGARYSLRRPSGLGARSQAESAADRLLRSPDLTEADVLTTLPALEERRWDALEERLLEGAIERQVAGFGVYTALVRLQERQSHFDTARETLEKAVQAQPQSAATLIETRAHCREARGSQGCARLSGPRPRPRSPEPVDSFLLGIVCAEENLLDEAYKSLRQAVALAPDNAYYNYAVGIIAQQRDPGQAVSFFQNYIARRPHDPRGRLQLGIGYFETHQERLAQRELESAARFRETAGPAHFFLGRLANQEGKYPEALRELQQALAAQPRHADPYAEEGIIYMKQKEYKAAEDSLLRALAIAPDHYAANFNLMMLYERTGDKRAAEQTRRFNEVRQEQTEAAKLALRSIEVVRDPGAP